jgi:long-chain acyl-CoA synthetase
VAPQPIEAALKQSPFIGEIVLVGDKQPTLAALVVPRIDELKRWAQSRGLETSDDAALVATREARALLKSEIEYRSRHLADFEKVKRFAVLPAAFSVAGGELTPTLKVKRRFIAEKYADVIAGLRRP